MDKRTIIARLVDIANILDDNRLYDEADKVDGEMVKMAMDWATALAQLTAGAAAHGGWAGLMSGDSFGGAKDLMGLISGVGEMPPTLSEEQAKEISKQMADKDEKGLLDKIKEVLHIGQPDKSKEIDGVKDTSVIPSTVSSHSVQQPVVHLEDIPGSLNIKSTGINSSAVSDGIKLVAAYALKNGWNFSSNPAGGGHVRNSKHYQGLAIDIHITNTSTPHFVKPSEALYGQSEQAKNSVITFLEDFGLKNNSDFRVFNEYIASAGGPWTGGHIHVQFTDSGAANKLVSGYVAKSSGKSTSAV